MHKLDEVIQHYGVKGMQWGVNRQQKGSGTKRGVKTLSKSVAGAMGFATGDPNAKLNTKAERRVNNILHYPLAALNGHSSSTPSRRIADDRTISKGEEIVGRYADRSLSGTLSTLNLIGV